QMEGIVRARRAGTKQDVINFKKKLKDGCKVSYISNARATKSDSDNWMALPLVKETETEKTCSRKHFLLLHVPSLKEFLHKFENLPEAGKDQRPPSREEPDIDTRSDVDFSMLMTSSVFADYGREDYGREEKKEIGPKKKSRKRLKKEVKKEEASPTHHTESTLHAPPSECVQR
ncbi:hypothetical protein PFISCL1PPCAC_9530, partial [Pristionchus fissidentatus]